MFSFKYETRYGDYKDYDNIKPSSIMDMVQDISTRASADCGYGINTMRELKLAWLLQGVKLHFEKRIRPDIPIEIFTAVKPSNGVTSERCCLIKQNGEIVGKTVSNWFIFNVERQRPTRIPKDMLGAYEVYDFDDDFFSIEKFHTEEIDEVSYTIKISNKEIDTNMHLNNLKSAELLMDALPFDFYFNEMNVFYKKPAFLGDELDVCVKKIEKGFYVHLQTKEKELCVAGTFTYTE